MSSENKKGSKIYNTMLAIGVINSMSGNPSPEHIQKLNEQHPPGYEQVVENASEHNQTQEEHKKEKIKESAHEDLENAEAFHVAEEKKDEKLKSELKTGEAEGQGSQNKSKIYERMVESKKENSQSSEKAESHTNKEDNSQSHKGHRR